LQLNFVTPERQFSHASTVKNPFGNQNTQNTSHDHCSIIWKVIKNDSSGIKIKERGKYKRSADSKKYVHVAVIQIVSVKD
jgi:hypothetical protein